MNEIKSINSTIYMKVFKSIHCQNRHALCRSRKVEDSIDNIHDGFVPFRGPSEPVRQHTQYQSPETGKPKWNAASNNVNCTCAFCMLIHIM